MPHMRVDKIGAIIFTPTKEEQEVKDMKADLAKELDNARNLSKRLEEQLNKLEGGR